jgi:hypothetical protein
METCKCGHEFTLYDAIIQVIRATRPTRPARVYCQRCWNEMRARFLRRFCREQSPPMARIMFAK